MEKYFEFAFKFILLKNLLSKINLNKGGQAIRKFKFFKAKQSRCREIFLLNSRLQICRVNEFWN